jgi:PEP-CTERM motif
MASLANAAMNLQISVDGDTSVSVTSIAVGGNLLLDITNTGNFVQPAELGYFGLIVKSGLGTISGGVVTAATPSASFLDTDPLDQADLAAYFGGAGVFGSIGSWTTGTFAGGTYFDSINFHADGPGDVLVQLVWTPTLDVFTPIDSLIVHVPEPATIVLLCLGGLMLRRRK